MHLKKSILFYLNLFNNVMIFAACNHGLLAKGKGTLVESLWFNDSTKHLSALNKQQNQLNKLKTRNTKGHVLQEHRIGFCVRLPVMSLNFV